MKKTEEGKYSQKRILDVYRYIKDNLNMYEKGEIIHFLVEDKLLKVKTLILIREMNQ